MRTIVRLCLCCGKQGEERTDAGEKGKESVDELFNSGKEEENEEGNAQEEPTFQIDLPIQEEAASPFEEVKMQEDGGEESIKPIKPKKKKASKSRTRRQSDPGQVPEGKHEPLPRDAKPRRSILKKKP